VEPDNQEKIKPKRSHRFQKGVSGNPAGRPKNPTLSEKLRARMKALAADVPWAADFLEKLDLANTATLEDLFIDATLIAALRGDTVAFREIWERYDGKVPQQTDVTSNGQSVTLAPIVLDGQRSL
jgi:hypothetical protein